MRCTFVFAPLFLASFTLASSALATTTEPNGLVVPRDSMNGEEQLYTMFQSLGDPVDWQGDALTTPATFSPLCSFSATFVLNQAGSHFGLAWYNATGAMPPDSDLHVIFPAGTAVGTTVNSNVIKSDPAYQGGYVGFALVGGQTHYTESQWNPVCTACSPQAPWILAVMYASKTTPNAYYIAFEDGNVDGASFANDGDFNDDVFFVTGITCNGGGAPCDTGMPGVCSNGVTECTPNGTDCKPLVAPGAETCNGIDDDCNGVVDDNAQCPAGYVCDKGMCVMACNAGEFTCPPSQVCSMDGYCVDPSCANVTCPSGQVCVQGLCAGPCDGVTCPYDQVCRVGTCVDPCDGVTCDMGQVCLNGACVNSCACNPCGAGTACDMGSGQCVEPACVGVSCAMGQHCAAGSCVDDCMGAVCPKGQTCMMGSCVAAPTTTGSGGASGSGGSTGSFVGSSGVGGAGGAGGSSASTMSTGSKMTTGSGHGVSDDGDTSGAKGGCGCRLVDDTGDQGAAALLGAAVFALALARRRREDIHRM